MVKARSAQAEYVEDISLVYRVESGAEQEDFISAVRGF
jgi:hypothetical protein